jgi:thiol:disulfide interchange protein DsbD
MPKPLPAGTKITATLGSKDFVVSLNNGKSTQKAEFYPFDHDLIAYAPEQPSASLPNGVRVWEARDKDLKQAPKSLHGLLKLSDAVAYEFTVPVVAGEIARPASSTAQGMGVAATPKSAPSTSTRTGGLTAMGAIGLAFLGGILLNLMPCVFPVLFLKALALVNSSTEEQSRLRRHGLVYTLGILVSFWLVVALLLVLRASGSKLGWGYQLQSPGFVAVLAAFLFFFALSLAGQFDLGLSLTSAGGGLAQKQGYAGSFFTGVLATVVATPCTAPLMGAAVGFALLQPIWLTFVIFTALALGLALPYVLLTAQPAWVRLLPKPGPWMEVLKQFTALILFVAAIWLTLVYGSLAQDDAIHRIALLLGCFLLLAVAGWALGRWPAKRSSTVAAALIVIAALAVPLWPQSPASVTWQPYSEQTLAAARAAGKPVFIDFTAAWCLSCQVNERLVLGSSDVEHALADGNVTLLKADWTNYNEQITAQLASVGRSGVPTYLIYPADSQRPADVLPELLTKSIVLDAIQRDTKR